MGGRYVFHAAAGDVKALRNSILICDNPVETFWQLGQISKGSGNFVLLGWRVSWTPIEDGVPDAVAKVLAAAMTSLAQVIFLSSDLAQTDAVNEWDSSGEKTVCVLKEPNPLKQLTAFLSGKAVHITLVATRTPKQVEQSLDDSMWSLETQIILLSEPERVLPKIDWQTLLSLFDDDWILSASQLQRIGIQCVLRPGVDGCVAGVLFLTDDFRHKFLGILENQSRAAGFDWELLSEAEFASSLSDSQT